MEYFNDFEEIHEFAHFYILFEFSPERPLIMDELGKMMMDLFGLFRKFNSPDYNLIKP